LRNPIDRAYSSYKHQVRAGRETLSFEEAIESEKKRLKGEKERLSNESSYFSYNYNHFSYLERGKYNEQIQNWLEYFPKEQMFILSSDEFFKNTESSLNKIYNFLEIKPSQVNIKKQYNTGDYKDSMPKETREKLSIFFEPYNIELKKLLKESLDWK